MDTTLKYQFLLLFLFLCCFLRGQCPTGNLVLSSQEQVEGFVKNYPDCSEIPGNVLIGTAFGLTDNHDLSPLSGVRSICGYLNISNNPDLASLHGLDCLISVNGYLNIFNDDQLTPLKNAHESLENAQARLGDLTRKIRENNQIIHRLQQDNENNKIPKYWRNSKTPPY